MVIDSGNNINSSGGAGKSRQNTQTVAPRQDSQNADVKPQAPVSGGKDNVSLSVAGKSLARVESSLAKAPEVDSAKVAEVKAALQDGSYTIDDEAIARGLLSQDDLF